MNNNQITAEKIKGLYEKKEITATDNLKRLDRKAKRPARIFSWTWGSLSALIMGSGMSLVMTDIGAMLGIEKVMLTGIIIGIIGMIMALINFPIYKVLLREERKKYADKILELSDKIIKGEENFEI